MRAWGAAVAAVVLGMMSGCATSKGASQTAKADTRGTGGSGVEEGSRYVDQQLGFAISRRTPWQMDVNGDFSPEGIATPVVMHNPETGAQVVLQVAPGVATPTQYAEQLTEGLRSHPEFVTSDPEPVPLSDEAVGFRFSMGDEVLGRVAVREGADGRVLMMLATWPAGAPQEAWMDVEHIFRSVEPVAPARVQ